MELWWNRVFESRISLECYQFFDRIENSITFAVTMAIHKSCNLIGTLGSPEFGAMGEQGIPGQKPMGST